MTYKSQKHTPNNSTVVSLAKGSHIVEFFNATYIGDHNYPEIEYQINIWNYADNKCEHFTVICSQPRLIKRMGKELI
jgi:hypothetical protein